MLRDGSQPLRVALSSIRKVDFCLLSSARFLNLDSMVELVMHGTGPEDIWCFM